MALLASIEHLDLTTLQPHEVLALDARIVEAVKAGDKQRDELHKILEQLEKTTPLSGRIVPRGF